MGNTILYLKNSYYILLYNIFNVFSTENQDFFKKFIVTLQVLCYNFIPKVLFRAFIKIKGGFFTMMKKIISTVLTLAMSVSAAVAVYAENSPAVYVDDVKIEFADQKAVIVDSRTLVPARGVFEAMGASVNWDGDTRTVQIDSKDGIKRVYLVIDDANMKVYTFESIFNATENVVTLDVAPQILNDRTMIPLRAISEAMGSDVKWDADAYSVYISTKTEESAPVVTPAPEATDVPVSGDPSTPEATDAPEATEAPVTDKTSLSLSLSADAISEGETIDVYVNVSELPDNSYVESITALISYSTEDFELVSSTLYNNDKEIPAVVGGENATYEENAAKITYITSDKTIVSGTVAKLTFKAKTGKGGEFALVNSYDTIRGYNTYLTLKLNGETTDWSGEKLFIDTKAVTVAGK